MPRQEGPFRWFSYSPVPPGAQPIHVDWRLLESGDVESEHIRVHQLVEENLEGEGEGLVTILHDYQGAHAKAVVLIGTDESLILPEGVGKKLEGLAGYPVVLITRSDGDQLLECLNVQYEDEELHAQLVAESVEALQEDDDELTILEPPISSTPSAKSESHKDKGRYQRPSPSFSSLTHSLTLSLPAGFWPFSRRTTYNVKDEVKKLLFDGENMRQVTVDSGLFTMVMATFSQYEKTASVSGSHSDINHLLQRLLRYFNAVFEYEFPFFLILAYRMLK